MDNNKKSIFIFYKSDSDFDYDLNSNTSWQWIGQGGTPNELYPNEIQFMGNVSDMDNFCNYIIDQFDKLLIEKKIIRYRISHVFLDICYMK